MNNIPTEGLNSFTLVPMCVEYYTLGTKPWHIRLKKCSYYAMLLCSKNHIITLPSPDHYALNITVLLMQTNLWPCHVIYHVAQTSS